MLGRGLVGAGRHDEAGAPDPVRLELLDHDLIEQRTKLMPHTAYTLFVHFPEGGSRAGGIPPMQ